MHSDDRLKGLDPTSAQEFDPRGDAARGVMAAAIARGSEAEAPTRSHRRPRVMFIAAGGAVAAAAVAVVIAGGGGGSGLGAADALADAASSTSHFNSGVVTVHTLADNGGTRLDATQTIKFSGTDWEVAQHGSSVDASGTQQDTDSTIRQVNGKQWLKDGADGTWTQTGDGTEAGVGDALAGEGLVALVKGASDVSQNGSTFHATVDGEALKALGSTPIGLDNAATSGPVSVTITLAGDGSVQKLEIDTNGVARTTQFSDMGAPQTIDTPQP
jgi:hypothetical protein